MKYIYMQCSRAGGKNEANRIAKKLLGLRVEDVLLKIALAVRNGASQRTIDILISTAQVRFEESLNYAIEGKVKL